VFEQARLGHAPSEALLDRAAAAVASAVANTHVGIDLDRVVIGGSVGLAPGMRERIERAFQQLPVLHRVAVEDARLGADAGLLGASAWSAHVDAKEARRG
jgi:N-acylmannosamine kinase